MTTVIALSVAEHYNIIIALYKVYTDEKEEK